MLSLTANIRDLKTDLKGLRKGGQIPAVFYGMGNESTSISVSNVLFKKVWEKAGESSTVKISIGPKISVEALIHDVQVDSVTNEPIHIDFLVIDMNKKIKVNVPLEFIGISEIVKSGLGVLIKVIHEVEIEALPKDLPHNLNVDITKLVAINSHVSVSDIVVPSGVTIITKGAEVVASVAEQRIEKEEVAEPVDLTKIEVEKKGKKEEEGEEGAETPAPSEKKSK